MPLALLLILINIGYTISANALLDEKTDPDLDRRPPGISRVTALFFAVVLGDQHAGAARTP